MKAASDEKLHRVASAYRKPEVDCSQVAMQFVQTVICSYSETAESFWPYLHSQPTNNLKPRIKIFTVYLRCEKNHFNYYWFIFFS
jgi:hypothetical protein